MKVAIGERPQEDLRSPAVRKRPQLGRAVARAQLSCLHRVTEVVAAEYGRRAAILCTESTVFEREIADTVPATRSGWVASGTRRAGWCATAPAIGIIASDQTVAVSIELCKAGLVSPAGILKGPGIAQALAAIVATSKEQGPPVSCIVGHGVFTANCW